MAEFVAYAPYGNYVLPGYVGTDPNATARFALIAGDAGLATEIGQAGGNVNVDNFGGINMIASSGAFVGIDSFANVSLNTSTLATATVDITGASTISLLSEGGAIVLDTVDNGSFLTLGLDVELQSRGVTLGGGDVNITNAGTIAFDTIGAGAITGVQTINGAVYPPSGSGATTSITQGGALVACLGGGAITISSIGVGADVEIYNAGTVRFDALGAGAISGLSTINGVAYPPAPASLSSITNGGGSVAINSNGTIALQATGSSFLTLNGSSAVVPNQVSLSAGSGLPEIVLGASGSNDININNPGSAIPSFLTMAIDGTVEVSGAAVNIANLSTVNGVKFVNGSAPYELPADITVSTLTAASYVSTLSVEGVSTIMNLTGDIHIQGNNNLDLLAVNVSLLDPGGAGFSVLGGAVKIEATSFGLTIGGNMNVSTITGLSTINGSAYPFAVSTIGDTATGYVSADVTNVVLGYTNPAIQINSDNTLILGSVTANTEIVYASTIQASADGLKVFEISGGANVKIDTNGKVALNSGISTITNGNGIIFSPEGASLSFPLDVDGVVAVGAIDNVSTINGVAYPPASLLPADITVSTLTADSYVSTASLVVGDINGYTYTPHYSGLLQIPGDSTSTTWIADVGSIPGFTNNAVVQATLQEPDGASQNWIVWSKPSSISGNANIVVEFASAVAYSSTIVAYTIGNLDSGLVEATAV